MRNTSFVEQLDENQEAVQNVDAITDFEPCNGEDLLESEAFAELE